MPWGIGMLSSLRRWIIGLAKDERGVSVIELAICAPVLAILVLGVSDLGIGLSNRYFLQQAANRAIELGHLRSTDLNYNHLVPEAAAAANVPESNVTLKQWLECNGTVSAFEGTCEPGQHVARFVKLTIRSSFAPLFGNAVYPSAQPDGTVAIYANATLRVQ